jgi:hypothetical protein
VATLVFTKIKYCRMIGIENQAIVWLVEPLVERHQPSYSEDHVYLLNGLIPLLNKKSLSNKFLVSENPIYQFSV